MLIIILWHLFVFVSKILSSEHHLLGLYRACRLCLFLVTIVFRSKENEVVSNSDFRRCIAICFICSSNSVALCFLFELYHYSGHVVRGVIVVAFHFTYHIHLSPFSFFYLFFSSCKGSIFSSTCLFAHYH